MGNLKQSIASTRPKYTYIRLVIYVDILYAEYLQKKKQKQLAIVPEANGESRGQLVTDDTGATLNFHIFLVT